MALAGSFSERADGGSGEERCGTVDGVQRGVEGRAQRAAEEGEDITTSVATQEHPPYGVVEEAICHDDRSAEESSSVLTEQGTRLLPSNAVPVLVERLLSQRPRPDCSLEDRAPLENSPPKSASPERRPPLRRKPSAKRRAPARNGGESEGNPEILPQRQRRKASPKHRRGIRKRSQKNQGAALLLKDGPVEEVVEKIIGADDLLYSVVKLAMSSEEEDEQPAPREEQSCSVVGLVERLISQRPDCSQSPPKSSSPERRAPPQNGEELFVPGRSSSEGTFRGNASERKILPQRGGRKASPKRRRGIRKRSRKTAAVLEQDGPEEVVEKNIGADDLLYSVVGLAMSSEEDASEVGIPAPLSSEEQSSSVVELGISSDEVAEQVEIPHDTSDGSTRDTAGGTPVISQRRGRGDNAEAIFVDLRRILKGLQRTRAAEDPSYRDYRDCRDCRDYRGPRVGVVL